MADIARLERALVNADKAGDDEGARKLAMALIAARENNKPRLGGSGTLLRGGMKGGTALLELPVQAFGGFSALVNKGLAAGARALGADNMASAFDAGAQTGAAMSGNRSLSDAVDAGFNRFTRPGSQVVETLGGAAIPTAGTIRAGSALAASAMPRLATVGTELASNPKTQFAAALAAGSALEGARSAKLPGWAQMMAAIGGGAVVPAALVGASGISAAARMRGGGAAREGASALLKSAALDPDAAAAAIANRAPSAVSGVVPTTAEASLDPGIAGLQRALMNMGNNQGARISEAMTKGTMARAAGANTAFGPGNPQSLVSAADDSARAMQSGLSGRVSAVGPLIAPEVSGENLRAAMAARGEAARKAASQMYRRVEALDEPIQVGVFDQETVIPPVMPDADYAARRATDASLLRDKTRIKADDGFSVVEWIKSKGGLKTRVGSMSSGAVRTRREDGRGFSPWRPIPEQGISELRDRGIDYKTAGALFNNKTGQSPDLLLTSAMAEGVLPEGSSLDDLLSLIEADNMGKGSGGRASPRTVGGDFADELERKGFTPGAMTDEDWFNYYRDDFEPVPAGLRNEPSPGRPISKLQSALSMIDLDFPGEEIPASLRRLVAPIVEADVMTVGQLAGRMRQLRALSGRLQGPPRAMAAQMADSIDGFVRTQATGGQAEALARARTAWRDYKRTFGEKEPGRILSVERFSGRGSPDYRMDAGRVPATAIPFGESGVGAAQRLSAAAGYDAALAAAREQLRREFQGVDARQVAAVADRYADTLRAYPELAADVQSARQAAAQLEAFSRSQLGRLAGDVRDPVAVVGQAINARDNGRAMANLVSSVRGNADAMAGLRRSVAENVIGGSDRGGGMISIGGEALNVNNVATLRGNIGNALRSDARARFLEPQQRAALKAIARELARTEYAMKANRASGSDTVRNAGVAARAMRQIAKSAPGGGGGGIREAAVGWLVRQFDRTEDVLALATEAMVDPRLAVDLLRAPTPRRVEALKTRVSSASVGATIGAIGQGADAPHSPPSM